GPGGRCPGWGHGLLEGTYGRAGGRLLSGGLVAPGWPGPFGKGAEAPGPFWGVRGGGGNFGVATSFAFQLHPVAAVLAGKISYPLSQAREVLRFYRELTRAAPDELTAYAAFATTSHGLPVISISLCYAWSHRCEGLAHRWSTWFTPGPTSRRSPAMQGIMTCVTTTSKRPPCR